MFEGIDGLDLKNNFYRNIVDGNNLLIASDKDSSFYDRLDPDRLYYQNRHGYRGKEFLPNAKLVSAGCSFTYGLGIPEEAIWSNIVAEKLNLSHNKIAKSGASISFIVEKLFNYFNEFGNPKYLICLFPDAKRFVVPVDGKILTNDTETKVDNFGEIGTRGEPGQFIYNEVSKSFHELSSQKYLKRPYNIRNIYTAEIGYYTSIRHLRMLEQYCKSAGITFLWATWDFEFSLHLAKINLENDLKFNNYFDINTFFYRKNENNFYKDVIFNVNINMENETIKYLNCIAHHENTECSCYLNCHSDLIDKYGEFNFHVGTDTTRGVAWSHPGCHLQAHYADRFLEELKSKI